MATQGTEKVLGGTPYKRYPDPASPGTPNAYGLSPWSAFKARLSLFRDGVISSADDIGDDKDIRSILFTTDIPVIVLPICNDANNRTVNITQANNTLTSEIVYQTPGGGGTATIPVQGKVLSGYSGNGLTVPVMGFPVDFFPQTAGSQGPVTSLDLMVVANGPVINGPVGPLDPNFYNSNAPVPILLFVQDYTESMRAAGNQILDSNGYLAQIVGLWGTV